MVGDPLLRKPATSSGPLPPIQAVAAKLSRSALPEGLTLIPQEGSGTRSGNTEAGGLVMVGTLADSSGSAAGRKCLPEPTKLAGTGAAQQPGPQQPDPFTTSAVTVTDASFAGMPSNPAYMRVTLSVTL